MDGFRKARRIVVDDLRACVERRVFPHLFEAHGAGRGNRAGDAPESRAQDLSWRRRRQLMRPIWADRHRQPRSRAIATFDVELDLCALGLRRAGPCPGAKPGRKRFAPPIGVKIAGAGPCETRRVQTDSDVRERRDRPPDVTTVGVESKGEVGHHARAHLDDAANRHRHGRAAFIDLDAKTIRGPRHRTGADAQEIARTMEVFLTALRHRPTRGSAVQRDIDRAVVLRGDPAGGFVVGREDAADEADQRQAVDAVRTDGVDIPPRVAAGRDVRVEARSDATARAADCPDRHAIGTPAPGWTLPPDR